MKLYWLNEDIILRQVRSEYEYWYTHIEQKRTTRRDDLRLYIKEHKEDVVQIHLIYTAIQTLLAINYQNEITVEFQKRKNGDEERAKNTNIIAEYDYWEMNLDVKDYVWEFNRLVTGVWIQTNWDFDFISICPTVQNIDSLAYIFDPDWWPTIEDHRFFWIETQMTKEEMKKAGYENYENIAHLWDTQEDNKVNIDAIRWQSYITDDTENKKYAVYIHWTIFNWEKYIIATWDSQGTLLKVTKLTPVFEEEKQDPSKIKFPIALKYFSYMPGDSMW